MKGCPENFVIFWCFSVQDMNHMWFEFRSSPTTPSWFFTEKSKKYTQYLTVLTNKNIWHKIWLILHHPKKFEHNWIKNGPAVRFYFWTLFANLNFLNFIACAIVHWCFNVETYCIYFWYRNNDEPKKLPGVDGRGLGWPRWDPSHSNPTPIPPGPIVQNCQFMLCLPDPPHMYSNVKLNFKASLFSSTFLF